MKSPILYTKSLAFGDCICATPTVRKLSQVYNQKVTVYSHFPEVFRNLKYVSSSHDIKNVSDHELEILKAENDVHITFGKIGQKVKLSDERGTEMKHAIMDIRQYHAIDLGFMLKADEMHCDFVPDPEAKFPNFLPENYVCLHPFKNWPSRTWNPERWNELATKLLENGTSVVIIGRDSSNDSMISYLKSKGFDDRVMNEVDSRKAAKIHDARVIDLTNRTSISEAWKVINGSKCLVTMDSGILHLAGTTHVNIVQLGSSIDPEFRAPYRYGSQKYRYAYVGGSCKTFCASNMKFYLRDWEHGYDGATPIQSVPLIDTCLEHRPSFDCHPSAQEAFDAMMDIMINPSWELALPKIEFLPIPAMQEIVKVQSGPLGDTIGALAVIDSYSAGKKITVICKNGKDHFSKSYPNMTFLDHEMEPELKSSGKWELEGKEYDSFQRIFYKFEKPLMQGYAEQLQVKKWNRPKIDVKAGERPIKGKYVCFSMHSTAQGKFWNRPQGWDALCRMLRKEGLTPVCIDRHESFGIEGWWNVSPSSCVRRHGLDLSEMTNYINHCEFFIGISSGLAWVAHAVGKPVVLISGITSKDNEFSDDTLRIINEEVCHGCINQPDKHKFDSENWLWCPVNAGTKRQFECTRTISPELVFERIKEWKNKFITE